VAFREAASKKGLGRCEESPGFPDPGANRAGDPGARGVTRRARATSSRARASTFSRAPRPAQTASSTQVEHTVRKPGCAVRGSPAPHAATRRKGQRNWHRLVPASSGAKASLACEERQLVRVCPRVDIGCRSRRTRPEVQRNAIPLANGRVDGDQASGKLRKDSPGVEGHRRPAPRRPSRGAGRGPSRAFERTSRGRGFRAMEGTSGRFPGRLVHASRQGAVSAALEMIRERANDHGIAGVATGVSEARYARITTGRQRPSR